MGATRRALWAKKKLEPGADDGDLDLDDAEGTDGEEPRIRCPRCTWEPREFDRWCCYCGHVWNTFDTAGRCPSCDFRHRDTMCLACGEWSKHLDWYTDR